MNTSSFALELDFEFNCRLISLAPTELDLCFLVVGFCRERPLGGGSMVPSVLSPVSLAVDVRRVLALEGLTGMFVSLALGSGFRLSFLCWGVRGKDLRRPVPVPWVPLKVEGIREGFSSL